MLRTAYQHRLMVDHADGLKQHQNRVDDQVRKANEIVSGEKSDACADNVL